MTFLTISKNAQGLITCWLFLIQMLFVFNFFRSMQIGKRRSNVRCIILCISSFVLGQILLQHMEDEMDCPIVLPLWMLLLLLALLTILALAEQYRILRWTQSHVSEASIKEALDALPMGLCYALPEGLPLLVNDKMEELGTMLFGKPFQDAKKAWEDLMGGRAKGLVKGGPEPIYELPGGKVYGFHREELYLEVGMVYAIFAIDMTEEYALTKELEEKQKRARVINARLKSLFETMEYVTKSRELLHLKVALHDNLGRSLLTAKRFIVSPESVDPKPLWDIWKENLSHLIGEAPEEWQITYYVARKEAATLGIELQIVGTLPEDDRLMPVIDQAISTHVINVLRHADGHTAMVHIWEDEKAYAITFTNDGNPPTGEIRETGGLGNLKRQVEALGGRMELSAKPRFQMVLNIPKS